MEWKVFASTFVAILLAEVGDKTQLATLTLAATSSRWLSAGAPPRPVGPTAAVRRADGSCLGLASAGFQGHGTTGPLSSR
jgi:hypothetical protein